MMKHTIYAGSRFAWSVCLVTLLAASQSFGVPGAGPGEEEGAGATARRAAPEVAKILEKLQESPNKAKEVLPHILEVLKKPEHEHHGEIKSALRNKQGFIEMTRHLSDDKLPRFAEVSGDYAVLSVAALLAHKDKSDKMEKNYVGAAATVLLKLPDNEDMRENVRTCLTPHLARNELGHYLTIKQIEGLIKKFPTLGVSIGHHLLRLEGKSNGEKAEFGLNSLHGIADDAASPHREEAHNILRGLDADKLVLSPKRKQELMSRQVGLLRSTNASPSRVGAPTEEASPALFSTSPSSFGASTSSSPVVGVGRSLSASSLNTGSAPETSRRSPDSTSFGCPNSPSGGGAPIAGEVSPRGVHGISKLSPSERDVDGDRLRWAANPRF